ncbi:glycerol channel [Tieghemiomyces parasiticus]|uniref:Glycerol channel n=1 Tax=Tieghemiomyces parasiticus TaxID=78921 RepID=A0A9W8A700_9FUNG|nr:glycerol channel [Tieghemiomyces parasiticus]
MSHSTIENSNYHHHEGEPYLEGNNPEYRAISMEKRKTAPGGGHARWQQTSGPRHLLERFHSLRVDYRDYLAEFFGTFVLIFLGDSVNATNTLFPKAAAAGSWILTCFGWGFALTMALFVSGGISGGHLNPAVTVTAALLRGFPWRKVPGYIFSQMLGGFVGAGFVFATFHSSIHDYDGGIRQVIGDTATAGIFATYPAPNITVGTAFLVETVCTAVLVFCIYGVTDERNMPGTAYAPLSIGFVVTIIGMAIGHQTGFAMNAARDLAPRCFTAAVGYGGEVFSAYDHYAWVPAIAPFFGAVVGGLVYDFFINHPRIAPNEVEEEV